MAQPVRIEAKPAATYAELKRQMTELQEKMEQTRKAEAAEVIVKMKDAIAFYGLTPADLFDKFKPKAKSNAPAKFNELRPPKYESPDGKRTWNGWGMRPQWFKDALAKGMTKEQLLIKAPTK